MNILNLDRNFTIEVEGYIFHGKFPTPKDEIDIDLSVGKRAKGVSLDVIPSKTYGYMLAFVTLDYVITDYPREFDSQKSWEDNLDPDLVISIYNEYFMEYEAFTASLKKNRLERLSNRKSRTDSGSVPDEKSEHDSGQKLESEQPISGSEESDNRVSGNSGRSEGLPGENRSDPIISRSKKEGSSGNDKSGDKNFHAGRGRIRSKSDS